MKFLRQISIAVFLLMICSASAFGEDGENQRQRRRHQGPPPEAYTACEGKKAGDKAEFEGRRGNTVTGTCEEDGDRLVLRPDHKRGSLGRGAADTSD